MGAAKPPWNAGPGVKLASRSRTLSVDPDCANRPFTFPASASVPRDHSLPL